MAVADGAWKVAGRGHWADSNAGSTIAIGFTALPGGGRDGVGGVNGADGIGVLVDVRQRLV